MDDGEATTGKAYGAGGAYVCNGPGGVYYNWGAGAEKLRNPDSCIFHVQLDDY
jgi:hypothetical protein